MIEITDAAYEELDRLATEEEGKQTVRIYYSSCGCGSATIGLVWEGKTANDIVYSHEHFDIVMDKGDLERFRSGVRIHFRPNQWTGTEFLVTPLPLPQGAVDGGPVDNEFSVGESSRCSID